MDITDEDDEVIDGKLYKRTDYFTNKYRSNNKIDTFNIDIREREQSNKLSINYTSIPMLLLGILSILILLLTITNNLNNGFIIFIVLLLLTLVWPLVIKLYNKRREVKKEEEYEEYLDTKNEILNQQGEIQKKLMIENSKDVDTCQKIILENRKELWERRIYDEDFLNINLGYTSLPMNVNINTKTDIKTKVLSGVPLTISLKNNKKINFVGSIRINRFLIQEIILQLVALHRYDELKIVLFTSDKYKDKWDFVKILPHNFSTDKNNRMFATNSEEIKAVCNYLNKEVNSNKDKPYYVIITDNIEDIDKYSFINSLLEENKNNISLLIMNEDINNISKDCDHLVMVNDKESIYYENKLNGLNQPFNINFSTKFSMYECSRKLANKPFLEQVRSKLTSGTCRS